MKVLIIGSKGFIGQNLDKYLKGLNYEVWGADVVVDYINTKRYFLIDVSNSNFHFIFEKTKFDLCVNCSGAASVPHSIEFPLRDFQLNTVNVYQLLDGIRKYQPLCKFINLSSAAVYGNPQSLPINEIIPLAPVSPYGIHKLMSEQICEEFHLFFNIPTVSLRIFSAYGEGLKKQLFWDLFQKIKQQEKIILWGTGKESRDFIHIQDLVQAIHLVALNAKFEGEKINVANGKEIFIRDGVAIFYSFFEPTIAYEFSGQIRKGDPNNWVADVKILKALGYRQKISLQEGLKKYYHWVKTENEVSA